MSNKTTIQESVPPVDGAIRNPSNPHHFMVIKPIDRCVRTFIGETLIADTTDAVRVIEIGKNAYDPLVYVPAADLTQRLEETDKISHCPLKVDAVYFAIGGEEIGWSYVAPFDFANQLAGRLCFWPSKVRIEEGP
ncbi:MAG: DUF427 domain-containing protein [Proteobacteria bacterium]|nr:DUF427 domain-containing protein [Pseudomonadota bacterium]